MLKSITALWLGVVLFHCVNSYYTSRRCYGTGDCHLMTKNQDGGFDDAKHQWLVECSDGEGVVAIRDDDTHFEGLSGLWCSFLFPLKQSSKGVYPYYPSCLVRNLTAGEYHCSGTGKGNRTTELFVSGIYKEPNEKQIFIPSLMKCCEMPTDYQIDYTRCYYKKTFDRFGEHYTGEWLVKCDTHHLVTGIGKDENPWDSKEHFTWIQCCPFYYIAQQHVRSPVQVFAQQTMKLGDQGSSYTNYLQPAFNDPGHIQPLSSSGRTDFYPEISGSGGFIKPARLTSSGPSQFYSYKPSTSSNYYYTQPATSTGNIPSAPTIFNNANPNTNVYGPQRPGATSAENAGYYPRSGTSYGGPATSSIYNQTLEGSPPSPPMNSIQYYANLAAYHQFINTFNDLLSNFTKQQSAVGSEKSAGYSGVPSEASYTPPAYPNSPQPVSLATSLQMDSGEYVQPPLPSGLQNYMSLTSANPGATLSGMYSGSGINGGAFPTETVYPTGQIPVSVRDFTVNPQSGFVTAPFSSTYPNSYGANQQGSYDGSKHFGRWDQPEDINGQAENYKRYASQLQQQNQQLQYLLNAKNAVSLNFDTKLSAEPTVNTLTVSNSAGSSTGLNVVLKTNGSLVLNLPTNTTVL